MLYSWPVCPGNRAFPFSLAAGSFDLGSHRNASLLSLKVLERPMARTTWAYAG